MKFNIFLSSLYIIIVLITFIPYILNSNYDLQYFYIFGSVIFLIVLGPFIRIEQAVICLSIALIYPVFFTKIFNDSYVVKNLIYLWSFLIIYSQIIYFNNLKYLINSSKLEKKNIDLLIKVQTDKLTGLSNRFGLETKIEELKTSLEISPKPVSVFLLDIDYFKKYNDTFGHLKGDICLQRVAHALKNSIKKECDFVARFGGEEFVIIINNVTQKQTIDIGKRILKNIENLKIKSPNNNVNCYLTASMGVSRYKPKEKFDFMALLDEADKQLYLVKNNKRNSLALEKVIY